MLRIRTGSCKLVCCWSPICDPGGMKPSSLCPRWVQKLYALCLFLLSVLIINFLFFSWWTFLLLNMISFLLVHHHGSKMLRSESNSSITQSPIGWQISHFLTLLHEPTSGMCVCTSERALLVLVLACSSVAVRACVRVSAHREWHPHEAPPLTISCHSAPAGFHACSRLCESHHLLSRSLRHCLGHEASNELIFSLAACNERFRPCSQVCLTIKQTSIWKP